MAGDLCLHPDLIEDVVEELLASDIISKDKVAELKNETFRSVDPNLLMDLRHKEVKKAYESLVDPKEPQYPLKRNVEGTIKDLPKVKDLKTIDKEIANTRRHLEMFQNQLAKKNESFTSSILTLEKEREQNKSPIEVVNLSEEEGKHYFNLHLDHLENTAPKVPKDKVKTWKPFNINPPPVINVITTFKAVDLKPCMVKFDEEELKLLELCKPIHVTGKIFHSSSSELQKPIEEKNSVVPNNSPLLDDTHLPFSESAETILLKQTEISRKVIRKWKLYTKAKITMELEEKEKKELLRLFFILWVQYIKYCKSNRKTNQDCKSEKKVTPTKSSDSYIEPRKFKSSSSLELQCQTLEPNFVSNSIHIHVKKQKFETVHTRKLKTSSKEKITICIENSTTTLNNTEKSKVHIKEVTPDDVGLVHERNAVSKHECKTTQSTKSMFTHRDTKNKDTLSKKNQEPIFNRYIAQEKIIAQQLSVIEKQKQLIFDLQAQNVETKSNQTLKKAQDQLANARTTYDKKLKPALKNIVGECQHVSEKIKEPVYINMEDKSEKLMKSMLQRQEYCKQLAEKTKLRKKLAEEEKAKLKSEQEENQRQEKLLRNLKIRMERQFAEEKVRNACAAKCSYQLQMYELTEKAKDHYNQVLLRKSFKAFKIVSSEIHIKSVECSQIYKQKLMKNLFARWKAEVKQSIELKNQTAVKFYCTKLLVHCWNTWRRLYKDIRIKVQVSEDMFALKLQERMLRRWLAFTAEQYLQTCCNLELAERLHRKHLLRHSFSRWKDLPRLMFAEREKEQRRRVWRQAVQELIPDFSPVFAEHLEV